MTKIEAHPIACIFPMLDSAALDELAADIKAQGQLFPIVRDPRGVVLDGRNRLEACNRAGVEPVFTEADPKDVLTFVIGANVKRRALRASQRAMAAAEAWNIAEKNGQVQEHGGDRSSSGQNGHLIKQPREYFAKLFEVGVAYVKQARTVLADDPIMAERIKLGTQLSLQDVYDAVMKRKGDAADDASKMRRLAQAAPDLAERVTDSLMSLDNALAELSQRQRVEREAREAATRLISSAFAALDPGELSAEQWAARSISKVDVTISPDLKVRWKPAFARRLAECLTVLAMQMEWEKGNANVSTQEQ
jgi:hypothetical protein